MIILLDYWVQQLPIPLLLQYSTLILLAFVAMIVMYRGLIHPLPWLRYPFGMKAAQRGSKL